MRVRILAEAESDAQEAANWYEDQRQGLGLEFLDSLTQALEMIENHPQASPGFKLPDPSREVRQFVFRRFPYKLIYEVRADEVLVLAIAHFKRRPNYWKRRKG